MEKIVVVLAFIFLCQLPAEAQVLDPKEKAKRAAEDRVNGRVDQGINKGLDKIEEGIGGLFKKKDKQKKKEGNEQEMGPRNAQTAGFSDFIPGNNTIFADDFSQDELMDFPAKWNSTGSGRVVELDGVPGRWLEIKHNTYVNPVMDGTLPENCTIEFDLFLKEEGERRIPQLFFGLTEVRDIVREDIYYKEKFYTKIDGYNAANSKAVEYGINFPPLGNKNDFPLTRYSNRVLRVSIACNKTRIRVYLDQTKIVDLPRIVTPNMRNNVYFQNGELVPASEVGMYIGNIRIASGDVDARSLLVKQLMDDGKAVTNDILFDVGRDVIKPASFDILKQIGDALVANPSLKIKIIGHTDSDGGDADNLKLSQDRAASVKLYITENFPVVGSRMQTDGMGEGKPVAANDSPAGKAKNRRVEFLRL
ncbi:OmpA family protein [Parapedobacter sp. 2B3]|uniref:OmpA family protein n=1 Tax=Parapedobacter sp. 2B3 TaxID=3342381 RepID=UPI0035B5BEAF